MDYAERLKSMTLEELWELFPVTLTPYRPEWKEWAKDEMEAIARILQDCSPVTNHIGSTSIPSIWSKPIVDILVEVDANADWSHIKDVMESSGYICMSVDDRRMSFNKGYTPEGLAEKVFHVHVHARGDNDELYFRDYLLENPDTAHKYEALKLCLLPAYRHDRDGYTAAKTKFVASVTALAKCRQKKTE